MNDCENLMGIGHGIDLSRFRVVHGDKVLSALSLTNVWLKFAENNEKETIANPKFIELLAINEDGQIVSIHDEAWTFQFLPIVSK